MEHATEENQIFAKTTSFLPPRILVVGQLSAEDRVKLYLASLFVVGQLNIYLDGAYLPIQDHRYHYQPMSSNFFLTKQSLLRVNGSASKKPPAQKSGNRVDELQFAIQALRSVL